MAEFEMEALRIRLRALREQLEADEVFDETVTRLSCCGNNLPNYVVAR